LDLITGKKLFPHPLCRSRSTKNSVRLRELSFVNRARVEFRREELQQVHNFHSR
jgi:hypothetical protein